MPVEESCAICYTVIRKKGGEPMSKRKKKGGKVTDSHLNLAAALINLITAILLLLEKLTE